ncbi:hypothetical protein [Sphingomonas sp. VNH70]|uniref:hypothetical protein n=1 Tax=Sphingomonas silueang TaxID=3156617 RepID=UPI0032B45CDB
MRTIVFRMTRLHQRLDDHIRRATDRGVPRPLDLFRLRRLRQRVKARLRALTPPMAGGPDRIASRPNAE